jgi:hypothetical protein
MKTPTVNVLACATLRCRRLGNQVHVCKPTKTTSISLRRRNAISRTSDASSGPAKLMVAHFLAPEAVCMSASSVALQITVVSNVTRKVHHLMAITLMANGFVLSRRTSKYQVAGNQCPLGGRHTPCNVCLADICPCMFQILK